MGLIKEHIVYYKYLYKESSEEDRRLMEWSWPLLRMKILSGQKVILVKVKSFKLLEVKNPK